MINRIRRRLMSLALGAALLSTTVQCDIPGSVLVIDRYDDHDHGFFDVVIDVFDPYVYEDVIYVDEFWWW